MKTVLYVNGKVGIWLCFERSSCIHLRSEPLQVGSNDFQPGEWIESNSQQVLLIVDGEQAQIDAYPLQPTGTIFSQISHTKALRRTLVNRFPDAIIQTPLKTTGLNAMLVQSNIVSVPTRHWLRHVEKSAVTFSSVTTTEEIVANLFASGNQPYLVISHALGFYKHTFCQSGHALFTRTLVQSENLSIVDGLQETLSHLRTTELVETTVCVYTIGLSDQEAIGIDKLEWVEQHIKSDEAPFCEGTETTDSDQKADQDYAVIYLAQQALSQNSGKRQGSTRHATLMLSKHSQLAKQRQRLLQLVGVSALTFCSAVYSGSKQWQQYQRHEDYTKIENALSLAIDKGRAALLDQSPMGIALADALFDTQALNSSAGPAPSVLLSIVAVVFTDHRELLLQELSWFTVDTVAGTNTIFANENTEQISSRTRISTEYESASKLVVTIVGNSNPDATLRDQHRTLDKLLASLERYRTISHLEVLEAPLTLDADEDRIGTNALEVSSRFRIRFQFEHDSYDSE